MIFSSSLFYLDCDHKYSLGIILLIIRILKHICGCLGRGGCAWWDGVQPGSVKLLLLGGQGEGGQVPGRQATKDTSDQAQTFQPRNVNIAVKVSFGDKFNILI